MLSPLRFPIDQQNSRHCRSSMRPTSMLRQYMGFLSMVVSPVANCSIWEGSSVWSFEMARIKKRMVGYKNVCLDEKIYRRQYVRFTCMVFWPISSYLILGDQFCMVTLVDQTEKTYAPRREPRRDWLYNLLLHIGNQQAAVTAYGE